MLLAANIVFASGHKPVMQRPCELFPLILPPQDHFLMRKAALSIVLVLAIQLLQPAHGQISSDSINAYTQSIEKYRTGKNIKLLYTESTPLKPEQQRSFEGLNYFPPDIKYLVEGTLVKEEEPETVFMKTSTERAPEYIKYGKVTFRLHGDELSLFAYQSKKLVEVSPGEAVLFIPFRDATNGKETYRGGRYVDCEIPADGHAVMLDFNKAYNPYCAYNPQYSCVIPPEENRLDVRIEAGEQVFEAH
jgi:uncharacterized protein (DUF1684 family)